MITLKGNAVSPGAAAGKLYVYTPFSAEVSETFCTPEEAASQIERYEAVKAKARAELQAISTALEKEYPDKAKIFTAHTDIIDDVAINEEITGGINGERWAGEWAIYTVYEQFIRMIKKARDPVIAERCADFTDVRKRLLRIWYGKEESSLAVLSEPVIIAAGDLFPSDTAALDRTKVRAILTETGGTASHSAIIARAYGIPAVLGIHGLLDAVRGARHAAVDAASGEVIIDPDPETAGRFALRQKEAERAREETLVFLEREGLTADGTHIDIGLNMGSAEKELEGAACTDFVGLFRTEFLYMGRDTLPSEEEQFDVYTKVLKRYGSRPVTLRTLDIGGDKTLSSMELPREDNPFLGNRALRLCFSHPAIFKTQLRAALRASAFGNLWLMLPMVGGIDDIRRAAAMIAEVKAELDGRGIAYSPDFRTGIMIEIPAIALMADLAAREVDFASIGTNDLCQYLSAADRMNPAVADYYQSYHPALFRIIKTAVREFNRAGKPVGVCGELGGDPLAAPVLAGLGIRKLSMGFASIAPVKRALSRITLAEAEALAENVVQFPTAAEVEAYLRRSAAE
ncbi:MAG: phosphoenolpyruvate--protein phosphotransferase [Treponema sp.]|jgi:phosphotransferase system enzyme I (PtsI)|nr:phosphoenolpyruvate--protein phosphotransferase [Treponema sp.]